MYPLGLREAEGGWDGSSLAREPWGFAWTTVDAVVAHGRGVTRRLVARGEDDSHTQWAIPPGSDGTVNGGAR